MLRLAFPASLVLVLGGCIRFTDGFVSSGSFVWSEDPTVQITVDVEARTLISGDTTYELELLPKDAWLIGCPTSFSSVRTEAWSLTPSTFQGVTSPSPIRPSHPSAEDGP